MDPGIPLWPKPSCRQRRIHVWLSQCPIGGPSRVSVRTKPLPLLHERYPRRAQVNRLVIRWRHHSVPSSRLRCWLWYTTIRSWQTRHLGKNWRMEFHPTNSNSQVLNISRKRKQIHHNYSLNNHLLPHVSSAKYLGCITNNTLDWGQHITSVTTKANNTMGFLRENLNLSSTKTKETAYTSMVRPTVEFASCVWDPHESVDINKIEMVQRMDARFVKHRYHNRSSVTEILEDLKCKSLETRRKDSRLTMMYKIIYKQVAIYPDKHLMKPQKQSRNSYVVPYASTTSRQQSFFPRTIRDWNLLPLSIKKAGSVPVCKARLATHFMKPGLPLPDPPPSPNNVLL